jgi:predicted TIM-barrel fold metal-dependent hydrolase
MITDFHCRIFPDEELHETAKKEKALPYSDGTYADLSKKAKLYGVGSFAVMNCAAPYGGCMIPFFQVNDPESFALAAKEIKSLGYAGVSIDPERLRTPADGRRLHPVFEKAAEAGLAVSVRCGGSHFSEYIYCTPERLCAVADRYRGATLIFSHLAGIRKWNAAAEELCGKQVYFDTAACVFDVSVKTAKKIISEHKADKILFGSDMPWCPPSLISAFLSVCGISGEELELIEHKNAKRLLSALSYKPNLNSCVPLPHSET